MSVFPQRRVIPRLVGTLLILLLLGQISVTGQVTPSALAGAASVDASVEQTAHQSQSELGTLAPGAITNCVDTGCPATFFASLDKCVERTDFCIYYDDGGTTEAEAEWAADQIQDYWDRFVALGFRDPKHSGQLEVYIMNQAGCNGSAGWNHNRMTTYSGCWDSGDVVVRMTLGHELTHRMQYAYDFAQPGEPPPVRPIQTKFLKEGSARATQDNWFTDTDHMPAAAIGFTYCAEAAAYLASTNTDLSMAWYEACVWWKYAMEQYGTIVVEPERGVDFVEAVYDQNTAGYTRLAAVNRALNIKAPGTDFDDSFKQFAVAIYTKDLAGTPDDSYNILDEDEVGSPGTCGSIAPEPGGTIQVGADAPWTNEGVSKYGIRYFEADIGANCPVVSASFHNDFGPAFYHVVTQNGPIFKTHVRGSGTDWTQSFMNDGATSKIVAIVGSLNNASQVDVTLECADPDIDIKMPNTGAPVRVQSSTKFLAQVLVTNGSPTGPVVAGLTNSDFSARVGGVNASITGGGFIQEQYWLVVRAPAGLADGLYDLEVMLEEPGTAVVVATDTEFQSVEYTSDKVDHVLVIDRSGSMGTPIEPTNDKINAAKAAANFYVDITRTGDGLSVVPYHHDVTPGLVFDMASVTAAVRTDAKNNYITPLTVAGATSIGDGLIEARDQRVGSPTGNPHCSFVLLSDGMENSERKWDTGLNPVQADIVATGCPVTTIAFGPESNETLMEDIAMDTGGVSFYNDVYVSSPLQSPNDTTVVSMTLGLGDTYEYAQGQGEGRQRFVADMGQVTYGVSTTHEVIVDDSVSEMLFALDWVGGCRKQYCPQMKLFKPDDTEYAQPYDFEDYTSGHLGWRVPNPEPGTWKMVVYFGSVSGQGPAPEQQVGMPYQVLASGKSGLTLNLLPPGFFDVFHTGPRIPIVAILSNHGPIPGVPMHAMVRAPDCGQSFRETMLPLFDDGEHGDGVADDGVYANNYTRTNCANAEQPSSEPPAPDPTPDDEGGYSIELFAGNANFQRMAKGAFAILEGDDTDGDGMPDGWEDAHGLNKNDPNDADLDPDLDDLTNAEEYLAGTDPHNSDSDGGGENDGSEVAWGQDPLDPSDDEIKDPDDFQAVPDNNKVQLTYDVKNEYVKMELWRAPSPDGPWNLQKNELPLGGAYEDAATNDQTFYYRLIAEDGATLMLQNGEIAAPGHRSAVLDSESVTPSIDPVPPQAFVVIDEGAASTIVRDVTLSFVPYEYEPGDPDGFSDITKMMLSNHPSFAGAQWQDFAQDVPWTLGGPPQALNFVYARFRDAHDNESVGTEADTIFYGPHVNYLPLVLKGQ